MKIDNSLISGSTTMLILALLDLGDKYGYEMIRDLDAKSYGTFKLKEGTLYPILHKLEEKGMVSSYSQNSDGGRMRKYYSITRNGKNLLTEKKSEWNEYVSKVNLIIG